MRKLIRVLDGVLAVFLVFIYLFIIYGSVNMPDKMVIRNSADRVVGKCYSVSALNDESVDFRVPVLLVQIRQS